MSKTLPPRPHLEHLKKQAKALLRAFRLREEDAVGRFAALRLKRPPTLSDAQHAIAREYGFESWSKLKKHVASLTELSGDVVERAERAFCEDDPADFRRLLEQYPALKVRMRERIDPFGSPLINSVQSREMLDVLLDAGVDINARSDWWAGGFGILDSVSPDVAAHAIARGAEVTVHAAARLGLLERLEHMIEQEPELVHARGGDGQTPLHFASTVEVAAYLVDHGAHIDAVDVDHESTPAQYMVSDRQDVARFLISLGCQTDILMAAALGDVRLVEQHLDEDPESIRMRVSEEYFPMIGSGTGGTIYQWKLGWYVSACQVARSFGHAELFELLMARCPVEERLLNACWLHDEGLVDTLIEAHGDLTRTLTPAERRHLAHAARNDDTAAARLMLQAGWPVSDVFGQHHATALHWAAWHGNVELVELILLHNPPLEDSSNEFGATPLGWAIHGSENAWHRERGDHVEAVEILLEAGASPPRTAGGTQAVRGVLRRYGFA